MKAKDIKEFELGQHCYGEILRINGINYNDLSKEDVLELIIDMFENNINASNLIKDTFKNALEYLQYDCIENNSSSCEQCGNWNNYIKCVVQ